MKMLYYGDKMLIYIPMQLNLFKVLLQYVADQTQEIIQRSNIITPNKQFNHILQHNFINLPNKPNILSLKEFLQRDPYSLSNKMIIDKIQRTNKLFNIITSITNNTSINTLNFVNYIETLLNSVYKLYYNNNNDKYNNITEFIYNNYLHKDIKLYNYSLDDVIKIIEKWRLFLTNNNLYDISEYETLMLKQYSSFIDSDHSIHIISINIIPISCYSDNFLRAICKHKTSSMITRLNIHQIQNLQNSSNLYKNYYNFFQSCNINQTNIKILTL